MENHNRLIDFQQLRAITSGSSEIKIGLIDGPIYTNHPDLKTDNILEISSAHPASCMIGNSPACGHGTFIAGMLLGKGSTDQLSICPNCTLVVRPIFAESKHGNYNNVPTASPKDLSEAIIDCVNAGAKILNLSLALSNPTSKKEPDLEDALNFAANAGVIVVAASGNQGTVGTTEITRHPWVIPVVACDKNGNPLQLSNLGNSIGRNGLCAPGENVKGLGATTNEVITLTGTSVAVPYVTGIIALLWSIYPHFSASTIRKAIKGKRNRKSIKPPVINPDKALIYLQSLENQKIII